MNIQNDLNTQNDRLINQQSLQQDLSHYQFITKYCHLNEDHYNQFPRSLLCPKTDCFWPLNMYPPKLQPVWIFVCIQHVCVGFFVVVAVLAALLQGFT